MTHSPSPDEESLVSQYLVQPRVSFQLESDASKRSSDVSSPAPHRFSHSSSSKPIRKKKSSKRSLKTSWWRDHLFCWIPSVDSDSDEGYPDITPSKMKLMDEDDLVLRLQQAATELGHRPTNYDIDSEILRYNTVLEIEQRLYEESGKPKFKYKWFRKNHYLTVKKHPLYGTSYENHRKLEVRLEEFRFGASNTIEDKGHDVLRKRDPYESKSSAYWRSTHQVLYANLALLCGASNFLRFPQACYANGGFTFLLTYCLMIVAIGQPLLYFEMVLGQYSLNGPSGFARLHPYARGIPYAIAFVCVFFGTARSIYLAYSVLYSAISLAANPGECGWWLSEHEKCIPYNRFEEHKEEIQVEKKQAHSRKAANSAALANYNYSIELFFRDVMVDAEWQTNAKIDFLNWKLVVAYVMVCIFALIPINYNLSGRYMKKYLRQARYLPIMIFILLAHQIIFRGAWSTTLSYFVSVDAVDVNALGIWSEAFDMVLNTLGIGYGFHWSISGNVSIDYKETYRISWRMCGYAILFGLLSSLVLYSELGIVGEFTGDHSYHNVFEEIVGISFVCYSGALLKLGFGTTVFVVLFFMIFVIFGMWPQIIVADVILRWIEQRHIIKGYKRNIGRRKRMTIVFLIMLQLLVISPYCFARGSAVLGSEIMFGGSLAAYIVVLAELIVTVYLYGFTKFIADLEILTKTPMPTRFQIQIRYVVIPTILLFLVPMMHNVYFKPNISTKEQQDKLGWLWHFGLFANFTPVFIMVLAVPVHILSRWRENQVNPMPFFYTENGKTTMEEIRARYPLVEPMFVAKGNAPSQQSHGRTYISEIYQVVEHNMTYVHECQAFVKARFMKLLKFKINQTRWLKLSLLALRKIKLKSFRRLVQRIMLARKYRNDKVDIRFLEAALEQIVNLNFYSAMRKLQRMQMEEMLLYMANELLKLTTFRINSRPYNVCTLSSSSDSSSSDEDGSDGRNNNQSSSEEKPRKRYLQVHRRLIGQMEKCPEESRTLLTIRLKRGLGLPHEGEISVLKFLRRERSRQERELSCWTQRDNIPIDHFVPSSIKNAKKEKVCFTIFHAVVVEGADHFVLKRLPVPRPVIVHVTKSHVQAQPGKKLTDKFAHIVSKRMQKNIERIIKKRDLRKLSKKKLKRHLWKVADRLDDDVYDFLDRILTCVIVVVPDAEGDKKAAKPMYLTPRTRRNTQNRKSINRRRAMTHAEITSYAALTYQQLHEHYWTKLLQETEPKDITYHDSDSDSSSSFDDEEYARSSSGSSSTVPSDPDPATLQFQRDSLPRSTQSAPSIATIGKVDRMASAYLLENETLQQRDNRFLKKKTFGVSGIRETKSEMAVVISADKIKHLSARKWKHERDMKKPEMLYTEREVRLQRTIDLQASQVALQTVTSKSMDALRIKPTESQLGIRKTFSLQSIRYLLESVGDFKVGLKSGQIVALSKDKADQTSKVEEKLRNTDPDLAFLAFGKTLIVDKGKMFGESAKVTRNKRSLTSNPSGSGKVSG